MVYRVTGLRFHPDAISPGPTDLPQRSYTVELQAGDTVRRTPPAAPGAVDTVWADETLVLPGGYPPSPLAVALLLDGVPLAPPADLPAPSHPEPVAHRLPIPGGVLSLTLTLTPDPPAPNPQALCDRFPGHEACVSGLAVWRDALVSVSMDNSVRLWALQDGRSLSQLTGHTEAIHSLALCGDTLATASDDHTIRLWNLAEGGRFLGALNGHEEGVNAVMFLGDSLVSASDDGTIKLWNLESRTVVQTLAGHLDWVSGLAVWQTLLLSCSDDGTIRAWDLASGECLDILHAVSHPDAHEDHPDVNCLAVAGDLLYAGVGPRILVWELQPGPLFTPHLGYRGHTDDLRTVVVDAAAGRLYSCGDDGTVRAWDLDGPSAPAATFQGDGSEVFGLCLHRGSLYAGTQDGEIRRWPVPLPTA